MAAELGIASTDHGRLRKSMGEWACYGNDPASFADAIRQAHARVSQPDYPGSVRATAKQHSWDAIAKQLEATILGSDN